MKSTSAKQLIKGSLLQIALIVALAASVIISCDASRPKPQITPRVSFNKPAAEMGTPVEVTYTFETSPEFDGLKKDLIVFVHFLDPGRKIRFVDDHSPPIRTNQWGPGRSYSYTRTYFLPENIPAGEYVVELGMYTPSGRGERFVLNAEQLSDRSYAVGKIRIEKPVTTVDYVSGWYDLERESNDNWYHWRWIAKSAILRTPNPKADSLLYIRAESERHRFQNPQTISIIVGGKGVDRFSIESSEPFVRKYNISAADLGLDSSVEIQVDVDQTFTPATSSGDKRELGLRVYSLYLGKERE